MVLSPENTNINTYALPMAGGPALWKIQNRTSRKSSKLYSLHSFWLSSCTHETNNVKSKCPPLSLLIALGSEVVGDHGKDCDDGDLGGDNDGDLNGGDDGWR